jgi:hypothetical protein
VREHQVVFPLIDLNGDGKVSVEEMEAWHVKVGLNSSLQRAEHEFTSTDRVRVCAAPSLSAACHHKPRRMSVHPRYPVQRPR